MKIRKVYKKAIDNPVLKVSVDNNKHYVYRHYYIDSENQEITFYVGKGIGNRAFTESGRNDLWKAKVESLQNKYSIDIVKHFDSESEALEFESELIAYYTIFHHECECNKQSKLEKASLFMDELNSAYLEKEIDEKKDIKDARVKFISLYNQFLLQPLSETMKSMSEFLDYFDSKYKVVSKTAKNNKVEFLSEKLSDYNIVLRKKKDSETSHA